MTQANKSLFPVAVKGTNSETTTGGESTAMLDSLWISTSYTAVILQPHAIDKALAFYLHYKHDYMLIKPTLR